MDAIEFLRADHRSVLAMLQALETPSAGASAGADRRNQAVEMVIAESQHESIEESLFWPQVREMVDGGDELADHGLHQEEEGKRLLQTIENSEAGTAEFESALTQFIAAAREHISFEETHVWPEYSAAAGADESEHLGERLKAAKASAPTRPHPCMP